MLVRVIGVECSTLVGQSDKISLGRGHITRTENRGGPIPGIPHYLMITLADRHLRRSLAIAWIDSATS